MCVLSPWQVDEMKQLRRQVADMTKSAENMHIDRADTINKLARSLEESQQQCQELLAAGMWHILCLTSYAIVVSQLSKYSSVSH